jgi:hypothetical protein
VALRRNLASFEARLSPPSGAAPAPRGKVEREHSVRGLAALFAPGGAPTFDEFDLRIYGLDVLDETRVDVRLNGALLGQAPVRKQRARFLLRSEAGEAVPEVRAGDRVTVEWRGRVVLEGAFDVD